MFKRALISVSDKTNLDQLAQFLKTQGTEVISTGGSAQTLKSYGLKVIEVSELTGFPEVMDGRVKTLHPKIHMGLLARDHHAGDAEVLKQQGGRLFDLVVVNLYPFEESLKKSLSLKDQVEKIDIGGPSLLRAAAKSFERITVLSHPSQYQMVMQNEVTLELRRRLAAEAFSHVSSYDSLVAQFLFPEPMRETSVGGRLVSELRYGENPHQKAWWYAQVGAESGWQNAQILQGKELSYNNLLDLDAAQFSLLGFKEPACVVVKHNNPCGVAVGKNLLEAVDLAINSDPLSCFGGIVAVNKSIDEKTAARLSELFLECVVAPAISDEAKEIFKKKKNQRVLIVGDENKADLNKTDQNKINLNVRKFTSIWGGFLIQTPDQATHWSEEWQVIGESPSESMKNNLAFAWKICASLKSNAIALTSGLQTVGLGMGQVSRVDAVEQAIGRFKKFHPHAKNVVAASDAFFPFPDSIDMLHQAGVQWIIQPGGSMKDKEVIARASELGITTVLTGKRHFRH